MEKDVVPNCTLEIVYFVPPVLPNQNTTVMKIINLQLVKQAHEHSFIQNTIVSDFYALLVFTAKVSNRAKKCWPLAGS